MYLQKLVLIQIEHFNQTGLYVHHWNVCSIIGNFIEIKNEAF